MLHNSWKLHCGHPFTWTKKTQSRTSVSIADSVLMLSVRFRNKGGWEGEIKTNVSFCKKFMLYEFKCNCAKVWPHFLIIKINTIMTGIVENLCRSIWWKHMQHGGYIELKIDYRDLWPVGNIPSLR